MGCECPTKCKVQWRAPCPTSRFVLGTLCETTVWELNERFEQEKKAGRLRRKLIEMAAKLKSHALVTTLGKVREALETQRIVRLMSHRHVCHCSPPCAHLGRNFAACYLALQHNPPPVVAVQGRSLNQTRRIKNRTLYWHGNEAWLAEHCLKETQKAEDKRQKMLEWSEDWKEEMDEIWNFVQMAYGAMTEEEERDGIIEAFLNNVAPETKDISNCPTWPGRSQDFDERYCTACWDAWRWGA